MTGSKAPSPGRLMDQNSSRACSSIRAPVHSQTLLYVDELMKKDRNCPTKLQKSPKTAAISKGYRGKVVHKVKLFLL